MRQNRLNKAVWYWNEDDNSLSVHGGIDKKKTKQPGTPQGSTNKLLERVDWRTNFYFKESIDQNQQMVFRQKYQRGSKPFMPNVVTMEDIKDTVMFLANGYIPNSFKKLFFSIEVNQLFRAVIVYIQLYLKVWEDLEYRRTSYENQRLKHPISVERETLCKKHLSKLRSRIGQDYAMIIAGEGHYKNCHHMNNTLNRSYTAQDIRLYDYLSRFTIRVVWIALNRTNYKEIEMEICRLFNFKDVSRGKKRMKGKVELGVDGNILQGDENQHISKLYKTSPVISDLFINQEIPEIVMSKDNLELKMEKPIITGLEAALKLPEELLRRFGITVGILGQPRDMFEPLLTVKQKQKSIPDEELEKVMLVHAEEVKPKIKMYEYIHQLEATIDLENPQFTDESADFISKIYSYGKIHREESRRSYGIWNQDHILLH